MPFASPFRAARECIWNLWLSERGLQAKGAMLLAVWPLEVLGSQAHPPPASLARLSFVHLCSSLQLSCRFGGCGKRTGQLESLVVLGGLGKDQSKPSAFGGRGPRGWLSRSGWNWNVRQEDTSLGRKREFSQINYSTSIGLSIIEPLSSMFYESL